MTAKPMPVKYPNLVDQIRATVDAHKAITDDTLTHAQEHRAKLDAKRQSMHVQHMASKLIQEDGK